MTDGLAIAVGVTAFLGLDILALVWLAAPWRCPLLLRRIRVRSLTEKIADIEHQRCKWGWSDRPSESAQRDRMQARLERYLVRLDARAVDGEAEHG